MLDRIELNEKYGDTWVQFIEYWNKQFKYASEDRSVWVYLNVHDIINHHGFLPPWQQIKALLWIAEVLDDGQLVYRRNT